MALKTGQGLKMVPTEKSSMEVTISQSPAHVALVTETESSTGKASATDGWTVTSTLEPGSLMTWHGFLFDKLVAGFMF